MSENPERPGMMIFPASEVTAPSNRSHDVVVAASHHPPHWLHPEVRRQFVSALRDATDLYLTGHEHVHDDTVQSSTTTGLRLQHIEGCVLQERGAPSISEFAVIAIDEVARTHAVHKLEYRNREGYQITTTAGHLAPFTPFPANRLRTRGTPEFSPRHREYLDDLGISLVHRDRGILRQGDVYVYPDLRETIVEKAQAGRTVVGKDVLDFVLSQEVVIVSGDDYSGKTALAKALCRDGFQRDCVPLLATATQKFSSTLQLDEWLENLVRDQYGPERVGAYRQTPHARRLIVVDDFEKVAISGRERHTWLSQLRDRAGHVVLIGDGLTLSAHELAGLASDGTAHYNLQPFGYLMDPLVSKGANLLPNRDSRRRGNPDRRRSVERA